MARVDLYVRPSLRVPPARVVQPDGRTLNLLLYRVSTFVRAGESSHTLLAAVVNTAAPLTIFPEVAWRLFEDEIEWFGVPDVDAWLTRLGWGSARIDCRVGRVMVAVVDIGPPVRSLAAVPTIALFGLGNSDDRIVLGLQEGPLVGRRLVIDVDAEDAYLEDR